LLYTLNGQHERARTRLTELQGMFPDDPNYVLGVALLHVLDGDSDGTSAQLQNAAPQLSPEQLARAT